jgi:hypothetical protein
MMGLGCGDALRDAGFLANAVWQGMSGPIPLDMALAGYETKRNAATLPDYKLNISLASFEPRPEQERQLLAAIAGDQQEMNRFFRAREGMIPPESYFNAENIARIIGAAQERMGKPAMAS